MNQKSFVEWLIRYGYLEKGSRTLPLAVVKALNVKVAEGKSDLPSEKRAVVKNIIMKWLAGSPLPRWITDVTPVTDEERDSMISKFLKFPAPVFEPTKEEGHDEVQG